MEVPERIGRAAYAAMVRFEPTDPQQLAEALFEALNTVATGIGEHGIVISGFAARALFEHLPKHVEPWQGRELGDERAALALSPHPDPDVTVADGQLPDLSVVENVAPVEVLALRGPHTRGRCDLDVAVQGDSIAARVVIQFG